MPLVKIEIFKGKSDEYKKAILEGLQYSYYFMYLLPVSIEGNIC